jgi:primosomal protein N'
VVFVDFDQELLAARMRAGDEALGLLVLASRLVGGRAGRVLVQTRVPEHPAVRSALLADPAILLESEIAARRELSLPPFAAVAVVSGEGATEYVNGLAGAPVEVLGPSGGEWMVKAQDQAALSDVLTSRRRPGGRLRIAVDPARM